MTPHRNHRPPPPDDWHPAAAGEVASLSRRLKARQTRRRFLKASGGVVGGLLAAVGGWAAFRATTGARECEYGGITCSVAIARADAAKAGTLAEAERTQLMEHVRACPVCKPRFEAMGMT